MRGELVRRVEIGRNNRRFIPACAGNSRAGASFFNLSPVHPRLRGELTARKKDRSFFTGSSPLARGTPEDVLNWGGMLRFIPACAGNSLSALNEYAFFEVHPRLRGELTPKLSRMSGQRGSSPLARGTPEFRQAALLPSRFIPACAGNSLTLTAESRATPGSSPLARGTL